MLDGFSRVFVVLLLLEVIFLELLNHLLSAGPKLAIELYHGHVLNNQVIGATPLLVFFVPRIFILIRVGGGRRLHSGEFRFLVFLELVLHDVLFDLALLRQSLLYGILLLVGAVQEVVLVDHF